MSDSCDPMYCGPPGSSVHKISLGLQKIFKKKKREREKLPGGPVVKTSPANAGGAGSVSGQGAKIPHALKPKSQNIKQNQYCTDSMKMFKMVQIKKKFFFK